MPELREVFDMTTREKHAPLDSWRQQQEHRDRRHRNRRVAALAVAAVIVVTMALVASRLMVESSNGRPAAVPTPAIVEPVVAPAGDFLLDIGSGGTATLPASIADGFGYHVSPDGGMVAYQAKPEKDPTVEEAIFVANIDGTDVHVISPEGVDARWPDWSPDGSRIVFQGFVPSPKLGNLFVYDVATGRATQLTDLKQTDVAPYGWMNPTFASKNRIYFHLAKDSSVPDRDLWVVDATGGEPKPLRPESSFVDVSPDGGLVFLTGVSDFTGTAISTAAAGPSAPLDELVAGAGLHSPRWSPDGTKVAYLAMGEVNVVDIVSGEATTVATGAFSDFDVVTWFDDHTLIVDRY